MLGLLLFALFQAILGNILPNLLPIINQISAVQEGPKEADESLSPRIAYGAPVDITEYPYFAGLEPGCGGAILSEEWVVTAAHCVHPRETAGDYVLVGGARKDNSIFKKIEDIIVHPNYTYSQSLLINDIALIKLAVPLEFKENVQPLDLPDKNIEFEVGSKLVFIGRGADESGKQSEQLMKIEVNIYPTDVCYREYYPNVYWYLTPFLPFLRNTTICSKRVEKLPGAGPGDSGSPMVKDNVLIGLASYGMTLENDRILFLTNVAHFVPWINSVTAGYESKFRNDFLWPYFKSSESVEYLRSSSESSESMGEGEIEPL